MLRCRLARIRPAGPLALVALLFLLSSSPAADLVEARKLLGRGAYAEAITQARAGIAEDERSEEWRLLLCEALVTTGRYPEARTALEEALARVPLSIRLRLAGREIVQFSGEPERAKALMLEVDGLASREWAYRSPADRIALGRAALIAGVDPKQVLDRLFDPVKKAQPDFRDAWLASGELALGKSDYGLASKIFADAVKKFPDDAEMSFGLAQSHSEGDTAAMLKALEKTLVANPHHTGAHLLIADHHIDAEQYAEAEAAVARALATNPANPEVHALRAVVAELRADVKGFTEARAAALKPWPTNPAVDHRIGRKFAQKYRFTEGAEHQRQALKFDPEYLPAKIQLAQDLLRLGRDDEGWKLAGEVQQADPYDVVAYNLVTLKESVSHFKTLATEHFLVRMDPREASIYGPRVVELLERAHAQLCKKYGLEPKQRTIVEIFPNQKDFAIRTFGLPGGDGYLGVCFGRVITANSPASRPGSPSNWEAVLWHEFAHVVTLQLTRNRMPRWLSEGISVYEERQARGSWGEQMKPRYRAMILGEDLTPVSQLSSAFLKPKSGLHLQFAYYESSLAVEYLLERFGLDKMKRLLADLAKGTPINAAIERAAGVPMAEIDREFSERARQLARAVGPGLDWSKPKPADVADEPTLEAWIAANPTNYTALNEQARKALTARDWEAAKAPLQKLIELYPNQHDSESAYTMLARAHRELGETDQELALLTRVADLSADATDVYARLMQLCAERKDWPAVLANAARFAAVNPLSPIPHRFEAEAREVSNQPREAIAAYETLLKLEPPNPSDAHYRVARLQRQTGDAASARRHVVQALEEAPRFRDALRLLLEINTEKTAGQAD